jgi:DNA gyrase subunit B
MDQALIQRYADYENMDDYPELQCLAGDSPVFTLERGWVTIRELAEGAGDFHVMAYDRELGSIVPARALCAKKTGDAGHGKRMVRVTLDSGASIRCTWDHLFMTKDAEWVRAGDLVSGIRLMPADFRMRFMGGSDVPYWQVHQPNSDSEVRASDGKRWTWIHRLVGEFMLGARRGDVVHHVDGNSVNNSPSNLTVEDSASHAAYHIAGIDNSRFLPEWTDERRADMSRRMRVSSFP